MNTANANGGLISCENENPNNRSGQCRIYNNIPENSR